jgi:uncharacterized membrane protein (UPF0182 family)
MIVTAAIIGALILLLFATASFWVDWWWYDSLGYRDAYVKRYVAQAATFVVAAAIGAGLVLVNAGIALRRTRPEPGRRGLVVRLANRVVILAILGAAAFVALTIGLAQAARWETWLLFLNGSSFGQKDPVFDRDVSFYVFDLPILLSVTRHLIFILIAAGAVSAFVYAVRLGANVRSLRAIPRGMRVHLLILLGLVFLAIALLHYLDTFELAYSERGFAFGAGYTDVSVVRVANWLLAITALAIAVILIANARFDALRFLVVAVAGWVVLFVVLKAIAPGIVQRTLVEPSELKREREYIENNIAMTRQAFALDTIDSRELSGRDPVTSENLAANPSTLNNIRLWDFRVIRMTFQQLQSFVPYYVFPDVDVERYVEDGQIRHVLLAAREFDQAGLPENAQTWTNRHLVFTHGYGVVVSPVSSVTPQGLPGFVVDRIPPSGTGVFQVSRPEIYFGEENLAWVAVDSGQPEFSGLITEEAGATDTGYGYAGAGAGSVQTSNYLRKLMLAVSLGDRNVLLSGNIEDETRILLHRNVADRIQRIAPFLRLDPDPYLVIADGRLVWIVDAYTSTDRYPHASRVGGVNYLRNSVKVTVDAYDGTVTFYRTEEPDPIADAYVEIFPSLFTPVSDAPPSIVAHFRYPELLFEAQSEIFGNFHVTDPVAFYNGEDRWAIPEETVSGGAQRMIPFYVTMTLPGDTEPEFALIRPYIPGGQSNRQNMTSWMAGRTDALGRTSLVVYRFPRQETVFGPRQIEARIDQEPEISAQISLWSQSGSEVIRGNLLVIPIENSVLYIEPLYLQATSAAGAIPELKRVIVASNDRVVMAETLDAALQELTGAGPPSDVQTDDAQPPAPAVVPAGVNELAGAALQAYEDGQAALAQGDWVAYGEAQQRLEDALRGLEEIVASPVATPVAKPAATPVPET